MELEKLGTPTVTLSTKYFQALAVRTAAGRGMPDLRHVILPFPLETQEEPRVRQAGLDACKPIVDALTAASAPSLSEVK